MPWTPYVTTQAKFIAITGFRFHAVQVRVHLPISEHQAFDQAVNQVVTGMNQGAVGCTGGIFDPNLGEIQSHISKGLKKASASNPNAALAGTALLNNPQAVATATQNLIKLMFEDTGGNQTQAYP